MRPHVQDDQVRHHASPLELHHVPLGAALVHLRVSEMQAEDLQTLHCQGMSKPADSLEPFSQSCLTQ